MPRGGRRNGAPGQAYGNRSDLNAGAKPVPVSAVPGQQYGAAKAQMDAQRAVPMQGTPMPATPGQPGTPDPLLAQANPVYAGDHGDPTRPTERPNEPVTAGLPVGAGPGPEVLTPSTPPDPLLKGLAILNRAGQTLPPEVAALARYVQQSQAQQVPQ
jgi:hypothetical protein